MVRRDIEKNKLAIPSKADQQNEKTDDLGGNFLALVHACVWVTHQLCDPCHVFVSLPLFAWHSDLFDILQYLKQKSVTYFYGIVFLVYTITFK